MLQKPLESARQAVAGRRVDITGNGRVLGLDQTLGVQASPAKAAAHEQALAADGNLSTGQFVAGQAANIAPITKHVPRLAQSNEAEQDIGQRRDPADLGG
ncbi:hypothetical protein D3C76_1181080 [compost metagenome]